MKAIKSTLFFFVLTITSIHAQISFTADVTTGCVPLTVNFTNTSTVGTNFIWNLEIFQKKLFYTFNYFILLYFA